ncbi:glycosyltransferase family 2 protein [Ensifer sesbaniae]|uniref:glycosyltransferase family 2 protein n=1 Tax=Ensifer sesbaniae TaxID=1214071 RepID=UPI001FE8883F|nr:glycosyltransferase family 2 protein [Ensifer sesbaniae]NRQ18227.1 Chondroitin synthase [Ensifer sesbaniae]
MRRLIVRAENDLSELQSGDSIQGNYWQAEGDDPFFVISFPPVRQRYLLISLKGDDSFLDPKIYYNGGRGFREESSVDMGTGKEFIIVVDIGSLGTICSIRLDPATAPCTFCLDIASFHSRNAAEEYVERLQRSRPLATLKRLEDIPRYWQSIRIPSFAKRKSTLTRYVERAEELAIAAATPAPAESPIPWLSIVVPVYNAPARYLNDLLKSYLTQDISGVELVLSDDGSSSPDTLAWLRAHACANVKVILNERNQGIARTTNVGIEAARGAWIALLDHDDLIAPKALKVVYSALLSNPSAQFLYTDELVVDDALKPIGVMLKPAFDPVLLSGVNYINHFSFYRRQRLVEIGLLRRGFEGSQDYDLLLRYLRGIPEKEIFHLPYPAYWWRRTGKTFSRKFIEQSTENARKALMERYSSHTAKVGVSEANTPTLHRVQFANPNEKMPLISIIIPNKDSHSLMRRVLDDLYHRTDYPNVEIIVIDNGTTDHRVLDLYHEYRTKYASFSAHVSSEPFNFSRSINKGMRLAKGEHFLLLNNDIEVIDESWLKEMVSCLRYSDTGIVGAKLLYPSQRIQHAGVIVGFGGLAGHWYLNKAKSYGGPMNRLHVRSSMTCVTGAVMLISRECAETVGQWDEENFAVAYNDVDYCVRAYKAGYRIVWTPFACLYHHESVSRGSDLSGDRKERFDREKANLRELHATTSFADPATNPGYSNDRSEPRVVPFNQLPGPRTWFQYGVAPGS